jgi:hypothetical protein
VIGLDLGAALVNLWKAWKEDREFQAWIKLVMSTVYSAVIAFLGTDGLCLVAGMHWLLALGSAMVATAVSIAGVLLRAPQGRSLILSIPMPVTKAIQDAENSGQVTIEGKDVKR